MSRGWIQSRVRSSRVRGIASISGYRVAFHKRGKDQSGKADASRTGNGHDQVWGVLIDVTPDDMTVLDRYEEGYENCRISIDSRCYVGVCHIYLAKPHTIDSNLVPYRWYHDLVIDGATEHQLPRDYIEHVRSFETVDDPDAERAALHRRRLRQP